ncbi:MAG: SDR family oxidoreductase [Rhodoferax sp.]
MEKPTSDTPRALALIIGSHGGLGRALLVALQQRRPDWQVWACARTGQPAVDVCQEASIAALAQAVKAQALPLVAVVNATGVLHAPGMAPEKTWRQIDPSAMAQAFAVNSIGPALLMKHLLPLLARDQRAVFATLSAKVGSIGDNRLGGWYSYRASKAALNQLVRTAAIELARSHPQALCVALHPGTVDTGLSRPFAKQGLTVTAPDAAAHRLLDVLDGLSPSDSGGFFNHDGSPLPW